MEGTISNPTAKRIALVTGANKGIGLEVCRQLASKGVSVVLTARDEKRGVEAVEKLKKSGVSDDVVVFHQLDVADPASIASLADFIKIQLGKLDILVNNAAIGGAELDHEAFNALTDEEGTWTRVMRAVRETYEKAEECLNINYHGTKAITKALIPFLQLSSSPRIVNTTSRLGKLRFITNESVKQELRDVDGLTEERLDELLQSFLNDFKEGKLETSGWPTDASAYKVSKVALSAYTRILSKRYPTFCINCVHPGFVKTDITWNTGILTVEEGARGTVMVALLPEGSPSGLFFDETEVSTFE